MREKRILRLNIVFSTQVFKVCSKCFGRMYTMERAELEDVCLKV